MYFKKTSHGAKKMFSCVCRADQTKKKSEKWSDILGCEGSSSTDIKKVTNEDIVAVEVLKFLESTDSKLSKFMPIKVSLTEYELKKEYVITYSGHGKYAIGVVLHDKKDHLIRRLLVFQRLHVNIHSTTKSTNGP